MYGEHALAQVAAFFCDALLRCDVQHSAELLGVALRVCDRVRYFVDREEGESSHEGPSLRCVLSPLL